MRYPSAFYKRSTCETASGTARTTIACRPAWLSTSAKPNDLSSCVTMLTREFGLTGIKVPVIGQGTWKLRKDGLEALRAGIKLGMTHIDTAEMYTGSEEVIGEAIHQIRDKVFIVSKVLPSNASYKGTLRACDASLKRLGTDFLDVYLLHWRSSHPIAETMRAMEDLAKAGKIRALGVSNFDLEDLQEAQAALSREKIVCNQVL